MLYRIVAIFIFFITSGLLLSLQKGVSAQELSLLLKPWRLSAANGAAEAYQAVEPAILTGKQALRLTYNTHGTCLLDGDASALIFDQNGWKYVPLANYGKHCYQGVQTVVIPLIDFLDINSGERLDVNKPLTGYFHVRFWDRNQFMVDIHEAVLLSEKSEASSDLITGLAFDEPVAGTIYVKFVADAKETQSVRFLINNALKSVEQEAPYYLGGDVDGIARGWETTTLPDGRHELIIEQRKKDGSKNMYSRYFTVRNLGSDPLPTPTVTLLPQLTPTFIPTPTVSRIVPEAPTTDAWMIRSVDAMKDTKDAICNQRSDEWIGKWMDRAVEVGANYVAISTPYDNPACGDAQAYTKRWIAAIRAKGLKVWHRHMPLAFEGIYATPKSRGNYLSLVAQYIERHADNYRDGDIFTPIPEPQNGGIAGITYCDQNVCQWDNKEAFNAWLRDGITISRNAFNSIGRTKMKIGYYGFDGFVAWGANNPDWNGILEDATIEAMGNITIDHYPDLIGTDMASDIAELEARYPGVDIIIGEWGTVTGGDTVATVKRTMEALSRPSVKGFNYWQFGPHGAGEQLINDDFSPRPHFETVKSFYSR
jgi:hypothetical protein